MFSGPVSFDSPYGTTQPVPLSELTDAYESARARGMTVVIVRDVCVPLRAVYAFLSDPLTYIASPAGRYVPTPPLPLARDGV